MATKDERPGLLSKVAMFVRNPTRDWSELDQPADNESSGYDKQALKAMIERKRQNDFVRKREFDQLRKLRNRDPGTLASMGRPSFFQTSLATDLDGRAVTLKKIDEIEAQMSRQWWKARAEEGLAPGATVQGELTQPPTDAPKDESRPYQGAQEMSLPFASTEPMARESGSLGDLNEFAPTQMATDAAPLAARKAQESQLDPQQGFSTSALFAFDADEMATDPELEEAAIRFANGDDAGAENGLLAALRADTLEPASAQSWAAALLDFYRATDNRQGFEIAANEFALYLAGAWPVWSALSDTVVAQPQPEAAEPQTLVRIWDAPATLNAQGMEQLRDLMMASPMPWRLGWSELQEITADAYVLMEALFDSLCTEPAHLQFDGHEHLVRALRQITPSGDRSVERGWWQVRLNALRAMGLQDDFELAALDYCITFEAAPPEWIAPVCRIDLSSSVSGAGELHIDFGEHAVSTQGEQEAMATDLVLQGEILGDSTPVLAALDTVPVPGNQLCIQCSALVRVDFAAAGGILNWLSLRQAEGKQVQFQNVHRLVAAFFNVIGINEYAKVVPRAL